MTAPSGPGSTLHQCASLCTEAVPAKDGILLAPGSQTSCLIFKVFFAVQSCLPTAECQLGEWHHGQGVFEGYLPGLY